MEYRTLELNIISAKDIKNVNLFSKMDVYAVVSLTGDPFHLQSVTTQVDKDSGSNPKWNFPVKFSVNETLAKENRLTLEVKLISNRTLGDTIIGTVHVPLRELVDNPADDNNFRNVSYKVLKSSGKSKGSFNFSYKFAEKVSNSAATAASKAQTEPVMAYPPQTSAGSSSIPHGTSQPPPPNTAAEYGYPPEKYGYPPQQPHAGYPPAQSGYGYPPQNGYGGYSQQNSYGGYPQQNGYGGYAQQTGYGYQQGYPQPGYGHPQAHQKPKKNKFGMGLGAGLLGGALGGMLIGDMVSDAADYEAGYDAGFDDAGGFDF